MSGCYGNSMLDRYFERELNRYLDELDRDVEADREAWLADKEYEEYEAMRVEER